jgi:DNA/RNA-binding domain of Phe-tRNA-synthetase-like protein
MPVTVTVAPHPLLQIGVFVTRLARPLGELTWSPPAAPGPIPPAGDDVRAAVRELLRHGGYKPSGRSKPASEYLLRAQAEGTFPSINPGVDVCNHVSLQSGLPISVVDLDLGAAPWSIVVCPPGTSYVFNPSGQTIDAAGLLALCDAAGPCGTPVKDAQRTKTSPTTRALLSVVWGTKAMADLTGAATLWYRGLTDRIDGAVTEDVVLA